MLSIAIQRVDARYRLPRAVLGEQPRLQRVVDDALARALEGAIEREGIDPAAYICIESVRALAPVQLREPDSALAAGVSAAIAAAIRQTIDDGSASVVRYGSRLHALVDLAASAMAGDFSRSWAWTQMGLWRSDFPLRPNQAAELIVDTLSREPSYIVGALSHLAQVYPDQFRQLATRATSRAWAQLTRAALQAAGVEALALSRVIPALQGRTPVEDQQLSTLAQRVLSSSAIAGILAQRVAAMPIETRAAIETLALLEAEPAAVRSLGDLAGVLVAIDRVVPVTTAPIAPRDATHGPQPFDAESPSRRSAPDCEDRAGHESDGSGDRGAQIRDDERASQPRLGSEGERVVPVPALREYTRTRYGGLLYLINLLPRLGLIEEIRVETRWADRGLRWVLHQLAMALIPVEPDDPAALVFAGLATHAPPPSSQQDPATEADRAAVRDLRGRVVAALHDLLAHRVEATGDAEAVLLDTCRRSADIAAEPGWIEVRFSLDDVSLDIRRVGLDVDPEWVPWLGIVLRFVYA